MTKMSIYAAKLMAFVRMLLGASLRACCSLTKGSDKFDGIVSQATTVTVVMTVLG